MKKINTFALVAVLAGCFVFPVNSFSQSFRGMYLGGRSGQTATEAVATTCSETSAKQIIYSGDARLTVPVAFGSSWSAALQMAAMMLGNLNANARAEQGAGKIVEC